jgi:FkbM family methyltransferase
VAFEPNPPQYNICKTYEDENIKVEPIALSNYEGRSSFYQTPANVGAASLLKPLMVPHSWDNTIIKIEDIEVTNLSNYCKKNKQYPEMIWMDVQGNELNVLLGMDQEVINNLQYICTEVGVVGYYEGHTLENDIKNLLNSFGFHLIFEKFEWEKEKFCIFKKRS